MSSATHKLTGAVEANPFWEKSPKAKQNFYSEQSKNWRHCNYEQFLKFMREWYPDQEVPYIDGQDKSYEAFRLRRRTGN